MRSLGLSQEEVYVLLEDTRKRYIQSKGLGEDETDNQLIQLGIEPTLTKSVATAAAKGGVTTPFDGTNDNEKRKAATVAAQSAAAGA